MKFKAFLSMAGCVALCLSPAQAEESIVNIGESPPPPENTIPIITSEGIPDARKINYAERPEDTLFIVALTAGDAVLDKNLLVYINDEDVLVPLSAFCKAVQFPIDVDVGKGWAQGWFIREENSFSLLSPFTEVKIGGKPMPVDGTVELHIDDIYVSLKELKRWFPLDLTFSFHELKINVQSKENLPFQEIAEREARWKSIEAHKREKTDYAEELKKAIFLPYKSITMPTVQLSHGVSASKSGDGTKTGNLDTGIQAYNDTLWHAMRFNATVNKPFGDESGPVDVNNVLFNFSRNDARANLLGPLKATEYEFGDVNTYAFPLTNGIDRGRGATVTNAPPNFVRDPNNFVVEGYATPGWDVEVYQDERLLDFAKVDAEGRYNFDDIELREGFNLFRVVLYGPNGEKEERYDRYYLGQDMVSPGQFIYQASALQSSTPLFNVDEQEETDPTLSLLGEYGLTEGLSAYGGVFRGPLNQDNLNAVGGGLRFSLGPTYTQVGVLQDASGARSAGIDMLGNITDTISFSAGHTEHAGYKEDERTIRRQTYAQLSKLFNLLDVVHGSISFGGNRKQDDDDQVTDGFTNRISGNIGGFNLSNELEYTHYEYTSGDDFDGDLTMTKKLSFGNLRGRLNYKIKPVNELTSGELQFQTDLSDRTTLGLGLTSEFAGERTKTFRTTIDHRFDKFRLGASAEYATSNDIRVGMNVTYILVPTTRLGNYKMTSSSTSLNSGQLQLIPFVDANGNGTYDEGEKTIPNVTFKNVNRGTKATSDEEGQAVLEGMSVNSVNKVTVDTKTLPDIYMMPAVDGLSVFGKTGTGGPLYYPVSILGEISGTLEYKDVATGKVDIMPGVEMMLLDENEKVVAQTYSEYDGFYTFQSVPMGRYTLYLPPSETIAGKYNDDSQGPVISLDADNTERSNLALLIQNGNIMIIDDAKSE